jgi:predicted nucleotidyltransferase
MDSRCSADLICRVDGWNGCCDDFCMAEVTVYPPGTKKTAAGTFQEAPARLHFDRERLGNLCRERGVARLDLFGSALREDFRKDSDVDLLAALRPEFCVTLLDWADLREKLSEVFGRPVDLVSRRAVEGSQNPYRKQAILSTAIPIYVEG